MQSPLLCDSNGVNNDQAQMTIICIYLSRNKKDFKSAVKTEKTLYDVGICVD